MPDPPLCYHLAHQWRGHFPQWDVDEIGSVIWIISEESGDHPRFAFRPLCTMYGDWVEWCTGNYAQALRRRGSKPKKIMYVAEPPDVAGDEPDELADVPWAWLEQQDRRQVAVLHLLARGLELQQAALSLGIKRTTASMRIARLRQSARTMEAIA